MTTMKSTLFLCLIALTAASCSKKFDLTDHYDSTLSFEVTDMERSKDGLEILVTDKRHDQLLSWLESNKSDWEPTHDTHAGLVIIYQENFSLILYRNSDFGVVRYIDDENITHNYKKIFDTGGLGFLDD